MSQKISLLPVGSKVKFGKYSVNGEPPNVLTWVIAAKSHKCTPAYPLDSITLLSEKIVDLRCFDSVEAMNPDSGRMSKGNNYYKVSNIDQWLNRTNKEGYWYVDAHNNDSPPTTKSSCGGYDTPYANRPGFLCNFSNFEKNAILDTTIRTVRPSADGGSYEDFKRKVFLPSVTEVGLENERSTAEGAIWEYFTMFDKSCSLTTQAYNNTLSASIPATPSTKWYWNTRTPFSSDSYRVRSVWNDGNNITNNANRGNSGIRPALNISSNLLVSDTVDEDDCYIFNWNNAPTKPTALNVPSDIYSGRTYPISWSESSDPEGNNISYVLEISYNKGEFIEVYRGILQKINYTVDFNKSSIIFRVKAVDSLGGESPYNSTSSIRIKTNNPPVISGSDSDLGVKLSEFTQTYTVTDSDGTAVTITESIDNIILRTYEAILGETNTFSVESKTWLKLTNGIHTMLISAKDSHGDITNRTYTFIKKASFIMIQNKNPYITDTQPRRISLTVDRNIPKGAVFDVFVCNNGFDSSPTWEKATSAVLSNSAHPFTNTSKTSSKWGVGIKIEVDRKSNSGECYINAIGGNFE